MSTQAPVVIPDPVTREVAARLPWAYEDVHRWLGILAAVGARPTAAAQLLELCAEANIDPDLVVSTAAIAALR